MLPINMLPMQKGYLYKMLPIQNLLCENLLNITLLIPYEFIAVIIKSLNLKLLRLQAN